MKIIISSLGKFHAFHLAKELNTDEHLLKLLTTFYSKKNGFFSRFRTDNENIDLEKVETNIFPLLISRLGHKIGKNSEYICNEIYDGWARNKIEKCDIFVGWSGCSLHALREAKSYGAITVLERGSSHILFQNEILKEEYEKYDIKKNPIDKRVIEKELREYIETDYISIPSSYVKKTFLEKGIKEEKLIHVPYGVNLSHFKKIPKKDNVSRIVFCGALTLRKGVHYLIEAFSSLNLKNTELVLIGTISDEIRPFLKSLNENIKLLGKVPHYKLYKYFSQGSVFIMPSIEEGLAMVIPQAMACGLPVICTTNTGGEDIVRDKKDGFIIPIRDVEALKEKIIYLYENKNICEEMGKSAMERVGSGFTWNDYGRKIEKGYKRILNMKEVKSKSASCVTDHYDSYWKKDTGWTPSHSFNDEMFNRHFKNFICKEDMVLDVGSGLGENYQERIKSLCKSITCLDVSQTAVDFMKKRGLNAYQQNFNESFKLDGNTFDKAICLEVLEHLFDPLFCTKEIYRILKPSGGLIVSVPNSLYFRYRLSMLFKLDLPFSISDFSNPWKLDHIRFFDIKSLKKLLISSGFKIKKIKSSGDCSIFDILCIFGDKGRFISSYLRSKLSKKLKLEFLGDLYPNLFAPHLIVYCEK